jgi:hypothetical protein
VAAPTDPIEVANRLADAVDRLRDDVADLAKKWELKEKSEKRWHRLSLAVAASSVVTLALVVAIVFSIRYSTHQAACVRDYTNASAARTNILTPASQNRTDALDELIRTLPTGDKAAFQRKLLAYLKASDTYQNLAQTNPPPLAPRFTC